MPDVTLAINGDVDKHGLSDITEQSFIRKQIKGKEATALSVSSSPSLPTALITTTTTTTAAAAAAATTTTMTTTTTTTTTAATMTINTTTTASAITVTIPDIANTMERKQPDGEDVVLTSYNRQRELMGNENDRSLATNMMLDRISHDLDYLLNRTKDNAKAIGGAEPRLLFPET
jgi:hypothetical protein